jgi:hypothetical protein
VRSVTAATTALVTDGRINCGGTTDYALTMFAQSALVNGEAGYAIKVTASGTGTISIIPASGETINGSSGYTLTPGDECIITYEYGKKNWLVQPRFIRQDATTTPHVIVANTNGTTAVDVFGSGGAPRALVITDVILTALDTTAGNIIVTNAGATVCTIAKGTTDTALVGQSALANVSVAKNAAVQVDSSSAGDAAVKIFYQTTELLNP